MPIYKAKACRVCLKEFQPTSGKQWRCPSCALTQARPEKAPLCKCGCGEALVWNRSRKGYGEYRLGHHLRMPGHNPIKVGHVPWNKGHDSREWRVCEGCEVRFLEYPSTPSRFCTQDCYELHGRLKGDQHPMWTGGSPTKHKQISIGGVLVYEHRVIMEEIIRRKLGDKEVVHHKDGDGLNNDPGNLYLFHCDLCHRHHHRSGAALQYIYDALHPHQPVRRPEV